MNKLLSDPFVAAEERFKGKTENARKVQLCKRYGRNQRMLKLMTEELTDNAADCLGFLAFGAKFMNVLQVESVQRDFVVVLCNE